MFVIMIDYRAYGVPDEYAEYLLKTISVLQTLKPDSTWDPKEFTISDDSLNIQCLKVPDHKIQPAFVPKSVPDPNELTKIAEEKKKIVISETYDSPF